MKPFLSAHLQRPLLLLTLITATMLILPTLDSHSLWFDEVRSVLVTRDWQEMWQTFARDEASMWLYYPLLHGWAIFGDSEFAVRLLSAFFAIASLPLMFVLGKRLAGATFGLVATVGLAVNAFFIQYAQEARAYSLVMLLVILASYLFITSVQNPTWKNWLGYGIVGILSIYAHNFAGFVLAAHALSLLFLPWRDIPWFRVIPTELLIGAAISPLLLRSTSSVQLDWVHPPELLDAVRLFYTFSGRSYLLFTLYLALGSLATVAGLRYYLTTGSLKKSWPYIFLGSWLFFPLFVILAISMWVKPIFVDRYLIIILPPLILLVTMGIFSLKRLRLFQTAVLLLIIFSLFSLWTWSNSFEKENWRDATHHIISQSTSNDVVLFFTYNVRQPFEYYLQQYKGSRTTLYLPELASGAYHPGGATRMPEPDETLLARLSQNRERIWLILSHHRNARLGRPAQARAIRDTLERTHTLAERQTFYEIQILLYQRTP